MKRPSRFRPTLPPRNEVDAELDHHINERVDRLVAEGWSPDAAREEAQRRFGRPERWKRAIAPTSRGRGLRHAAGDLLRDLRYGIRQVRRHPYFATIAILTMGVGIGVTTAIFSAARQVVWPDLPFRDPDGLVRLYQVPEGSDLRVSPRIPLFTEIRDGVSAFSSVAGSRFTDVTLETQTAPERAIGNAITPGWLQTIGVEPVLGRPFSPEEENQGESSPVVLISHSSWQQRFGASPDVLGQTVRLNGTARSVVGVLPPGFDHPYGSEFWLPLNPESDQGGFWALNLKARLAPGRSLSQATQELDGLARAVGGSLEGFTPGTNILPVPIREALVGEDGRTLSALMIAVGFLLLIVCANLANLLVSRSVARRPEFALRASLGASKGRLVQQSVGESLTLAGLGGILGVAAAGPSLRAVSTMLPENLVRLGVEPTLDSTVLLVSLLAASFTGVVVGVIPGLGLSRRSATETLSAASRGLVGRGERSLGRALAISEMGLTLVLLTAVGLLLRDFQLRSGQTLGYAPEAASIFTMTLDPGRYETPESKTGFVDGLIDALEARPGIVSAAATNMFPRHQGNSLALVEAEGSDLPEGSELPTNHRLVSEGYLETMGATLRRGRHLSPTDDAGTPLVAVVNESLAGRLWPDQDPLGQRLRNARLGDSAPWITVVGVVADIREADDVSGAWYLPYRQHGTSGEAAQLTVVARGSTRGTPPQRAGILTAVAEVDPAMPIYDFMSARAANDRNLDSARQGVWVGSALGAFGLFLAALGIYGTVAYFVGRRLREFGVRRALGSGHGSILSIVVREVGVLTGMGSLLGLVGAVAAGRLLAGYLSVVRPFDPVTYLGAGLLMTGVALVAALVPTVRALRADPVIALRSE